MKTQILFALTAVVASLAGCGRTAPLDFRTLDRWDARNAPSRLERDASFERVLAKLPTSARRAKEPWAGWHWPSREGGIANRWNAPDARPTVVRRFVPYASPSREELARMDAPAIAALSPAEKYDILRGRYDYPTVREEIRRLDFRFMTYDDWEGLCHGWANAALHLGEPGPVTSTNADGIVVPFAADDVKALLSYYVGEQAPLVGDRYLGGRCDEARPDGAGVPECDDVNAGAFHVVLANALARDLPLVADVRRGYEVWNEPVSAFESIVLGEVRPTPGSAPGTVKRVLVRTHLSTLPARAPLRAAPGGASTPDVKFYRYWLELSAGGEILGGEWEYGERPDFLWTRDTPVFTPEFAPLEELYAASLANGVPPSR